MGLASLSAAGLAATYSLLGSLAAMTGRMFGEVSANPWLTFAMANAMLIAAAMMADVIPVRLPARSSPFYTSVHLGVAEYHLIAMGQLVI